MGQHGDAVVITDPRTNEGAHVENDRLLVTDDGEHIQVEGTKSEVKSSDDNTQQVLYCILKEMRIMNMHLALLTDVHIRRTEVE